MKAAGCEPDGAVPVSIGKPPSTGRIVITPSLTAISWISIFLAASVDADSSLSGAGPLFSMRQIATGDLRAARRGAAPGLRHDDVGSQLGACAAGNSQAGKQRRADQPSE